MAGIIQESPAAIGPSPATNSLTATLPSAATAGNLLVAHVSLDKASGAINTPAGWTKALEYPHTGTEGVSAAAFYKVAAGGETGITFTWTTIHFSVGWIAEVNITSAVLDASAQAEDQTTTAATSTPTATTGTTTAQTYALAFAATDSDISWGTIANQEPLSWTGLFTHRRRVNTTTAPVSGFPGLAVADRDAISSGTAVATSASWAGNTAPVADQSTIFVLAFRGTGVGGGGGGGDVTPPANPTGLTATGRIAGADLGPWDANTEPDFHHYNVYRAPDVAGAPGTFAQINANPVIGYTTYTALGLTGGTTYWFAVRAVDASGNESGNSNTASAVPTGSASGTIVNRWVGGTTDVSTKASCKATGVTNLRLAVSTESDLSNNVAYSGVVALDAYGRVVAEVAGLVANTQYYWGWERDGALSTSGGGRVHTFPPSDEPASFSFAYGSCADQSFTQGQNPSSMTHVLNRNPRPLFVLMDGDVHYYDINSTLVADHLAGVDNMLAFTTRQQLFSEISMVRTWSDHDFCGDASNKNNAGRDAAVEAFRRSTPNYPYVWDASMTDPITQTPFVVGRVAIFMLDSRSQKDPYTSGTDATRSLLGTTPRNQRDWLCTELGNWKNYVKIVIGDVPWMAGNVDPAVAYSPDDDHWGAYRTERKFIADYVNSHGIKNVFIMAGDMHCAAADDGGTKASGIYSAGNFPVFQSAPWARAASFKGDGVGGAWPVVYDMGPYPAKGTTAAQFQYGWVDVTDTGGSTVNVTYRCYDSTGAVVVGPMSIDATLGENIKPDGIAEEVNDSEVLANFRRDPDLVR